MSATDNDYILNCNGHRVRMEWIVCAYVDCPRNGEPIQKRFYNHTRYCSQTCMGMDKRGPGPLAYREARREELAANGRAWYAAHKEERAASQAIWYEAHKEEVATRGTAWNKAHPEKRQAQRARSRIRKQTGMTKEDKELSADYRLAIAHDPCFYCGETAVKMNNDHYVSP